ncbi:hypothetical protein BDZ45DRAFT_372736 [Acephala macrosclerotiorum]|nr:hypothetical protein BDZ45DRAFT_372736 [Acephala macrosclerotiorum]
MIENRTPLSEIQEESSSSTSDISRSKLESRNVGGPASDVSSWPLSKVDNAASEISGLQSDDVYLTELNFASSIEDEIQLRADEALHVIHEYDDGWGSLCSTRSIGAKRLSPQMPLQQACYALPNHSLSTVSGNVRCAGVRYQVSRNPLCI